MDHVFVVNKSESENSKANSMKRFLISLKTKTNTKPLNRLQNFTETQSLHVGRAFYNKDRLGLAPCLPNLAMLHRGDLVCPHCSAVMAF